MKELSRLVSAIPVSAALAVDLRAKALAAQGKRIINFCVGEPDFPTPSEVCEAGIAAIQDGKLRYTNASGLTELKQAIADRLRTDHGLSYGVEQIAVTTGGKYAVYAAACALVNPGDKLLLPAPYWTSYRQIIRLSGAEEKILCTKPENGWKLTPQELLSACDSRTKALILNNPNNPTGALYTRKELAALAEAARQADIYLIADEIYGKLCFDGEFCALASLSDDAFERTVTIGGVSKAYAMTGWRIGYAAGRADLIAAISALLSHTTGCPVTASQHAAICALRSDGAAAKAMCEAYRRRRDRLVSGLSGVPGLSFVPPQGAFYLLLSMRDELLAELGNGTAFAEALLTEEGVAAVPCSDYGCENGIRLSFSLSDEALEEGIAKIRHFAYRHCGQEEP